MCREAFDQSCPLTLLARHGALVCPCKAHSPRSNIPCRRGLNKKLEKYFASEQSKSPSLRNSLFFHFYPILLKILRRYCHPHAGCHKDCITGDILSDMYIAFAKYLDQFDASRQVGFLSYMIGKLSWRAFNSFAREHRVRGREILWDEERWKRLGRQLRSKTAWFQRSIWRNICLTCRPKHAPCACCITAKDIPTMNWPRWKAGR